MAHRYIIRRTTTPLRWIIHGLDAMILILQNQCFLDRVAPCGTVNAPVGHAVVWVSRWFLYSNLVVWVSHWFLYSNLVVWLSRWFLYSNLVVWLSRWFLYSNLVVWGTYTGLCPLYRIV